MINEKAILSLPTIFRLGLASTETNDIPVNFACLAVKPTESLASQISSIIAHITSSTFIELIIIPNRYFSDLEVMQTVQVRNAAHMQKNGIAIVMSATDAQSILDQNVIPITLYNQVYKISTIRHGYAFEKEDENTDLLIGLAQKCSRSTLKEIVIRACYSAGSIHGLVDPITKKLIGHIGKNLEYEEDVEEKSRNFLHGEISIKNSDEYKSFKKLTFRTQTLSAKSQQLSEAKYANVLYSLRAKLDLMPSLKHLSVKAYYEIVNPVPENNPIRMGLWRSRRPADLTYPKSVRLLSTENTDVNQKPGHTTRLKNR